VPVACRLGFACWATAAAARAATKTPAMTIVLTILRAFRARSSKTFPAAELPAPSWNGCYASRWGGCCIVYGRPDDALRNRRDPKLGNFRLRNNVRLSPAREVRATRNFRRGDCCNENPPAGYPRAVRGLDHFSARTSCDGPLLPAENIDLPPLACTTWRNRHVGVL
jgi:hypothetical protein